MDVLLTAYTTVLSLSAVVALPSDSEALPAELQLLQHVLVCVRSIGSNDASESDGADTLNLQEFRVRWEIGPTAPLPVSQLDVVKSSVAAVAGTWNSAHKSVLGGGVRPVGKEKKGVIPFVGDLPTETILTGPCLLDLPPWQALFPYLGPARMLKLLTHTAVALYQVLPGGCMLQLTGVPIGTDVRTLQVQAMKSTHSGILQDMAKARPTPSTGSGSGSGSGVGAGRGAGAAAMRAGAEQCPGQSTLAIHGTWSVPRTASLMYRQAWQGKRAGFPKDHPWHVSSHAMHSSTALQVQRQAMSTLHHIFVHAEHIRVIARSQIPQWVLHYKDETEGGSASTAAALAAAGARPVYSCTAAAVPPHVVPAVSHMVTVLSRLYSGTVRIGKLLRSHCPEPDGGARARPSTSTTLQPMNMVTPHERVVAWILAVLHALVPSDLLHGSCPHNARQFTSLITSWVCMGRGDGMTVQQAMQGIRTTAYDCFLGAGKKAPAGKIVSRKSNPTSGGVQVWNASASAHEAERAAQAQAVQVWILWLLQEVVRPLLYGHFYITEGQETYHRLLYYRKPVWSRMCRRAYEGLKTRLQLRPVPLPQAVSLLTQPSRGRLGYSTIRLVPKSQGLRPITNLRLPRLPLIPYRTGEEKAAAQAGAHTGAGKRPAKIRWQPWPDSLKREISTYNDASAPSINFLLSPLHEALKYEHRRDPTPAGGACFGIHGVHAALRRFNAARNSKEKGDVSTASTALAADSSRDVSACSSGLVATAGKRKREGKEVQGPPPYAVNGAGGSGNDSEPALYAFSADVASAYDSVPQELALQAGQQSLAHEGYVYRTYGTVRAAGGGGRGRVGTKLLPHQLRVRSNKLTHPTGQWPVFHDWVYGQVMGTGTGSQGQPPKPGLDPAAYPVSQLGMRNTVFYDLPDRTFTRTRAELLSLLSTHLQQSLLYLPGAGGMFQQGLGIPQGSVLSSMLCNLFLGRIERESVLPRVTKRLRLDVPSQLHPPATADHAPTGHAMLIRHTDDWIGIAEERRTAEALAAVVHLPETVAAVSIKASKTQSTFPFLVPAHEGGNAGAGAGAGAGADIAMAVERVVHPSRDSPSGPACITWCGLSVSATSGEVRADNRRYYGPQGIRAAITVSFLPTPVGGAQRMLRAFIKPRCQPVLLDGHINSVPTVAANVYEMAVIAGAKLACALRTEKLQGSAAEGNKRGLPDAQLMAVLLDGASFLARLVRSRCPAGPPILAAAGPGSGTGQGVGAEALAISSHLGSQSHPVTPASLILGPHTTLSLTEEGVHGVTQEGRDKERDRRDREETEVRLHRLQKHFRAASGGTGAATASSSAAQAEAPDAGPSGESGTADSRPLAWCPISNVECRWLALTAFAQVFARLHGTFPAMPSLLLHARDRLHPGRDREGKGQAKVRWEVKEVASPRSNDLLSRLVIAA